MGEIGESRREEDFRALLRRIRKRTTRQMVKLPPLEQVRRGRRPQGLAQSDIDTLLGWPVGTYYRLESGRVTHISEKRLRNLNLALKISEEEHVELHLLAGYTRPHPLYDDSEAGIPSLPLWQTVIDLLPFPAYVTDLEWDLVGANDAFCSIFASGEPPKNTMRWMLFAPEAREEVLVDWANSWAPACSTQVRLLAAEHPENVQLQQLHQDVLDDPVLRPIHDAAAESYLAPDGDSRPFWHRVHGKGTLQMASSHPSSSPGARIIVLILEVA
ncbi:helix-turn-helix domain-containing protein [Streptomyces sp. NBC_00470]|uniref:MmyB family transcriptional regulator n=1 Tax=Streptomyces sp. NBC_00470 TaxID=2975753 RepID=UPI002F91357B